MIKHYLKSLSEQYSEIYSQGKLAAPAIPSRSIIHLLILAGLMLASAAALYSSLGYHGFFTELNGLTPHIPNFFLHNITCFGDGALILALVFIFAPKHIQFHWITLIAGILGAVVSNVLKDYFNADRPPSVFAAEAMNIVGKAYHHRSFPSGHTLTAFLIASTAYCFVNKLHTKVLLLLIAFGVGLSRVFVGVHWPVDILVGGALGILCGCASIYIATRWNQGLKQGSHAFILFLLVFSGIYLLQQKKDYPQANFLLYISAFFVFFQFIKHYLIPSGSRSQSLLKNSASWSKVHAFFQSPVNIFWLTLGLLTVYRILVILQPHVALFYDESYYYHWSLYPDLGYYSKPPMVAWFIWLSTNILGPTTLGLKIASPLLYGGSAIFVYLIGQRVVPKSNAGPYAGIIFLTIPLVSFNSEFITTDAPLFFFWSISLYLFILGTSKNSDFFLRSRKHRAENRNLQGVNEDLSTELTLRSGKKCIFRGALLAIHRNNLVYWSALGLSTGLGMLSKYTMGALPLALFLYLLVSKQNRVLLLQIGPWLAAVIAGLVFGLNIYWNFEHDWIAAKHTQEISQTSGQLFHFGSLATFLLTQFLIFGPVWSYLLIKSIPKLKHQLELREPILIFSFAAITILAAISLQAFLSRAFANWAGPWVIAASLLLGACSSQINRKWLIRGILAHLLLLSLFYHWPHFAQKVSIPLSKKTDPYHRVLGWEELGEKLSPILQQYPDAYLASDSRDLLAYLGFYSRPGSLRIARWQENPDNIRDWYDLKFNLREDIDKSNRSYIFISKGPLDSKIQNQFREIDKIDAFTVPVYPDFKRTLTVYLAKGFKGYGQQ